MSYTKPSDFEKAEWLDVKEDRGIVRRQRVYRNILMTMGMFKTEETEEDFAYIRNYRKMISSELEELLDCELQIHRTSAFLILGEKCRLGRTFPEENTVSDIVLLCCRLFQKEIKNGKIQVPLDERICLSVEQFEQILEACKSLYGKGFNKTYREKTTAEFTREISDYMEELQLIQKDGRDVYLSTVIGKIAGEYPADFEGGKDE
jgi:uncharacterized protein (TIGR02678 family)